MEAHRDKEESITADPAKVAYERPEVILLGEVEEHTALVKRTGPPDILAKHRLIG